VKSTIDCSDLYDNAAERLKKLDSDIDKTIQDLAKEVEARGVLKNKVARQVVKELTAREVLSKSRIYEGLGTEQKRKYRKREIEETFPQVEITSRKFSTNQQAIQAVATGTGRSETLKDMYGRLNIKLVSEEQKQTGALRQENKSLKESERLKEKEESELIKEIADLRKEYARLKSKYRELKRQLAEKTEQISELRKDNEGLQKDRRLEFLRELMERFYDKPGMLDAKQLQKISEKAGRDLETYVQRYNTIILGAVELGQPVPLGLYIIIKPNKVLVPIRLEIDFDKRKIEISLWEKKLEIPPPSLPVSSDASKVRF
jgi:DNA repair exonuclease SbcCD ATPase subunit